VAKGEECPERGLGVLYIVQGVRTGLLVNVAYVHYDSHDGAMWSASRVSMQPPSSATGLGGEELPGSCP
jgi:hypothetical protein